MAYLEELLPEFRKGAKIRKAEWSKGKFIVLKNGAIVNSSNYEYPLSIPEILSNQWEFYKEPEPDWDYIIKNKCLCWFWCEGEEERRIAGLLSYYDSYENQFARYKGKDVAVTYFDHCRPVRRDEVTFYEERKDE